MLHALECDMTQRFYTIACVFLLLFSKHTSLVLIKTVFIIKSISSGLTFDISAGNKCEHPWPQMEEIADLNFVKKNMTNGNVTKTTREFQYTARENAPMYWPGEVPLHQVKDVPVCGFDGKCSEDDSNKGRLNVVTNQSNR